MEWTQYFFMRNALFAVLLVTPVFALLGTMVVNNRMAFFSDSLGHSAFTGIAIGVILGLRDPLISMIILACLIAISFSLIKKFTGFSPDTIIGIFSATTIALGVVILSHGGGFTKYSRYLIGDILSITSLEITILGLVLLTVMLYWILFFNNLFLTSINPVLAKSRGVRVLMTETVFVILIAVVVTVSIQWVGILVINALLILPAAAARNLALNTQTYNLMAVIFSFTAGCIGLILSYYWGTAAGATIVLCNALFFLGSLLLKTREGTKTRGRFFCLK